MSKKENNHGGLRKGAGRKPAPYVTKVVSFRVRREWVDEIKKAVQNKIDHLSKNIQPKP